MAQKLNGNAVTSSFVSVSLVTPFTWPEVCVFLQIDLTKSPSAASPKPANEAATASAAAAELVPAVAAVAVTRKGAAMQK